MTDVFYQISSLCFLLSYFTLRFNLTLNSTIHSTEDCKFSFSNLLPTHFQITAVLQLSFADQEKAGEPVVHPHSSAWELESLYFCQILVWVNLESRLRSTH